jgi:hypothetical protein
MTDIVPFQEPDHSLVAQLVNGTLELPDTPALAIDLVRKCDIIADAVAKARSDAEVQAKVGAQALRAKAHAGHLLATMDKNAGGRPSKTGNRPLPVLTLDELGVSKRESSEWQRLYSMDIEQYIAMAPRVPTVAGALHFSKGPAPVFQDVEPEPPVRSGIKRVRKSTRRPNRGSQRRPLPTVPMETEDDRLQNVQEALRQRTHAETVLEDAEWLVLQTINTAIGMGATWQQIGDLEGITDEEAQERYGNPID